VPRKRGLEVAVFRVWDGSAVIGGICGKSHIVGAETRRSVGVACKTQMAAAREVCWLGEHVDCWVHWTDWKLLDLKGKESLESEAVEDRERREKFNRKSAWLECRHARGRGRASERGMTGEGNGEEGKRERLMRRGTWQFNGSCGKANELRCGCSWIHR